MAVGALAAEMLKTFGTYMLADYGSNWIQHPTQEMDYGIVNAAFGRPVDQKWWGTRLEHIVGVAAGLAVTDYASQFVFNRALTAAAARGAGVAAIRISHAATPGLFALHTFAFIAAGVGLYCAYDAAFSPLYEGKDRMVVFEKNMYATVKGSITALHEPWIGVAVMLMFAPVSGPGIWLARSLIPATVAYATVKGFGWDDFGTGGLNDHEKKRNRLPADHVPEWYSDLEIVPSAALS